MAEEKRAPLKKFNTPVGVASYPHLSKPDTKFNDEGDYKCDVILDPKDAVELVAYLEEVRDAYVKTVKVPKKAKLVVAPVFRKELDDTEEPTGNIIIATKLRAGGTRKDKSVWTEQPALFDSDGNPLVDVDVWSGSKVIVAGTVKPYDMVVESFDAEGNAMKFVKVGVSLACRGVQVVELVSSGNKTAASFGFGKVEGGYKTAAAQAGLGVGDNEESDSSEEESDDSDF